MHGQTKIKLNDQ